MPPGPMAKDAPKKRNRKRKRRQAASSSSSSSSDSSSEGETAITKPPTKSQPILSKQPTKQDTEESSSSPSSSSSSSDSSDDDSEDNKNVEMKSPTAAKRKLPSRSPSPADRRLSMNIHLQPSNEEEQRKDAEMKEKFRKFWMMTTAEGFKDELGQIQKEPNMTQPKLAMLIDALSGGANVYMSSNNGTGSTSERSEVELLLGVHK